MLHISSFLDIFEVQAHWQDDTRVRGPPKIGSEWRTFSIFQTNVLILFFT
jgi:hypothetical protein